MSTASPPRSAIVAAGIQLASQPGDIEANLATIERLGRALRQAHAELELLVVPELGVTGYTVGERFIDVAERWPDGPSLRRLSALAADLGVVLVAGYAEASTAHVIYDSAAVFERDGTPLASYRKTHCLDSELRFFANGDDLPVVSTSVGRLGVMICWDAAFPEVARTHTLAGADLLVTIAAWEDPHVGDWDLVVSARAYDNVIPVVAVNRAGADGAVAFLRPFLRARLSGQAHRQAGRRGERAARRGGRLRGHATDESRLWVAAARPPAGALWGC